MLDSDQAIRSGLLRKAFEEGDKVVRRAVDMAARWLGIGLGSVANLLNPERIVLGGGVTQALGAAYVEKVEAAMKQWAFASVAASTQLVVSQLGDDAGVLGAAFLARRRLVRESAASSFTTIN
jgi:glucokinase